MPMDARKSSIFLFAWVFSILFRNLELENILQIITHLVQYAVWEIHFCSVKYTSVTVGYAKILQHAIPSHSTNASNYNG